MRTEIELQPNFVFSRHNGVIIYITNSRGPAPVLDPYCFGPVLPKRPSENSYVPAATAGTIKQFVSGAVLDHIDPSGSMVYLDQFLTAGVVQTNFLVDGLNYTDIETHDFSHLYQQSLPSCVGAKIIGARWLQPEMLPTQVSVLAKWSRAARATAATWSKAGTG